MAELEQVTKAEVKEALIRLGASILGLKQGWASADLTRHIDLDVGVLFRFIQPLLAEADAPPSPAEPAPIAEADTEPEVILLKRKKAQ